MFSNNLPTTSGTIVQVNNWNRYVDFDPILFCRCPDFVTTASSAGISTSTLFLFFRSISSDRCPDCVTTANWARASSASRRVRTASGLPTIARIDLTPRGVSSICRQRTGQTSSRPVWATTKRRLGTPLSLFLRPRRVRRTQALYYTCVPFSSRFSSSLTDDFFQGVASTSTTSPTAIITSGTSSVSQAGATSANSQSSTAASSTPSSSAVVKASPSAALFAVLLSIVVGTFVCTIMLFTIGEAQVGLLAEKSPLS